MPEVAIGLEAQKSIIKELVDNKDLKSKIYDSHTEEIIIGLCGPIGTDIHCIAEEIESVIKEKFDYEVKIIRMSEFIKTQKNIEEKNYQGKYNYVNALIDEGNSLRKDKGLQILAELAISTIAVEREERRRGVNLILIEYVILLTH